MTMRPATQADASTLAFYPRVGHQEIADYGAAVTFARGTTHHLVL